MTFLWGPWVLAAQGRGAEGGIVAQPWPGERPPSAPGQVPLACSPGLWGGRRSRSRSSDGRLGAAPAYGCEGAVGEAPLGTLSPRPREWDKGPSCSLGLVPDLRPAASSRGRKALDVQRSGTEWTASGRSSPWGWEALWLEPLSPGDGKALLLGTPPQAKATSPSL